MTVSRFGYPDIAELLLDHGAHVNAREEDFLTALHLASLHGRLDVVKVLLDRGADIDARDIDGRTPSGLASRTGGRDIVRLLLGVKVGPQWYVSFAFPFPLSVILTLFLSI
jgi:ankyrin repeat protein